LPTKIVPKQMSVDAKPTETNLKRLCSRKDYDVTAHVLSSPVQSHEDIPQKGVKSVLIGNLRHKMSLACVKKVRFFR
jgi:hypothetical protein